MMAAPNSAPEPTPDPRIYPDPSPDQTPDSSRPNFTPAPTLTPGLLGWHRGVGRALPHLGVCGFVCVSVYICVRVNRGVFSHVRVCALWLEGV